MENTYKNYWDFLKKTPKNLRSIVVIWGMALIFISTAIATPYEAFDPSWSKYGLIIFMVGVMGAGLYRPYTSYKKFKK